jgi:pimeloyl-ACP methyl ester carboxylesterase
MTDFMYGDGLFASERGSGPAIVIAHGGLANHQSVGLWAAPLAEQFRLITPDLRGSGRSHFAGPLSWELLADDVATLARHLGLERIIVGGISFGSGVAVATALRHPALVAGLVAIHPAFGGAELGLLPAQQEAMAVMAGFGQRTLEHGMEALFPLMDRLPEELRARARAVIATYDPASVAATTAFMNSGAQPFGRAEDLAAITAPALVIPGIDPTHPLEVAEIYRRLPDVRFVETPDFAAAVRTFATMIGGG